MSQSHLKHLIDHYQRSWQVAGRARRWSEGPSDELPPEFCVLEVSPTAQRDMWTYATCGMSLPTEAAPVELHLFSSSQTERHVELLTVIAHHHHTARRLGLGDTVNLGRPWLPSSFCDHGLISLPYLDGPDLEQMKCADGLVRCLWLVPITKAEVDYKKVHGIEALEKRLEEAQFDYAARTRPSVV